MFCTWQWRLAHTDHNWNSLITAPVPIRDLYLAKLLLTASISELAQACIGEIFGLLVLGQGWSYAFPYSLLSLGMRANTPEMTLTLAPFLLTCAAYTVLFAVLSIRYMQRREATEE